MTKNSGMVVINRLPLSADSAKVWPLPINIGENQPTSPTTPPVMAAAGRTNRVGIFPYRLMVVSRLLLKSTPSSPATIPSKANTGRDNKGGVG